MHPNELRNMQESDLQKLLSEKREELREFRFKLALRSEKNVKTQDAVRTDIARILTVLREKELARVESKK